MIGWALKKTLTTYSLSKFQKDLTAGFIVSLVALPLAMTLSIAVGLPPQYGLYTAIVAGTIVPLLGGSVHQVSGPTAAFVVIIAPIVTAHGLRGLILTTMIAGVLLVIAGILKIGKYVRYIPYPVTIGFTSGIAVVIGVLSLKDFLGLQVTMSDVFFEKVSAIVYSIKAHGIRWPELIIGLVSIFFMGISKYIHKNLPAPIVGIMIGTLVSLVLAHYGFEVETIGTHFHYELPNGHIGLGIPPFMPNFQIFGFSDSDLFGIRTLQELQVLFVGGVVVAALAALESVLSAAVADGMAGTKHQPNSELVGIGIGNILCGLVSGIPATGAIARTAINIQAGGQSPVASSLHGIFILAYVLFLSDLISYLPMSSLAALLFMTAYRMSHIQQFIRIIKIGPLEDSISLVLCFLFTVSIDMVAGVTVGVITSCFLLIKKISEMTTLKVSRTKTGSLEQRISHTLSSDTVVYHINGSIFFGNVEEILAQIESINPSVNLFVIDLMEVHFIDMTGMVFLKRMFTDLCSNKKKGSFARRTLYWIKLKRRCFPAILTYISKIVLKLFSKQFVPFRAF